MLDLARSLARVVPLAVVLAGCSSPNPAYDPDAGAEQGTDGSETPNTLDGSEDPSTTNGDGDGDPTDTTDPTDPTVSTEGMEAPDPVEDLPSDSCNVPVSAPLKPTFGNPETIEGGCTAEGERLVKVFDNDGTNWLVGLCEGSCSACSDEQLHPLGAPGLAVPNLVTLPQNQLDPVNGCLVVEFDSLMATPPSGCVYASISVFQAGDGNLFVPLFAATRDNWGLTAGASETLEGWMPTPHVGPACSCDQLDQNGVSCCGDATTLTTYGFGIGGLDPIPAGGVGDVKIGETFYDFHAIQGQSGSSCMVDFEFSWALVKAP